MGHLGRRYCPWKQPASMSIFSEGNTVVSIRSRAAEKRPSPSPTTASWSRWSATAKSLSGSRSSIPHASSPPPRCKPVPLQRVGVVKPPFACATPQARLSHHRRPYTRKNPVRRRIARHRQARVRNPADISPPGAASRQPQREIGKPSHHARRCNGYQHKQKRSPPARNPPAKYSPAAGRSVEREMRAMKEGKLKSGRSGKKVTSRKQAIAIGLSEARKAGKKVPTPKR